VKYLYDKDEKSSYSAQRELALECYHGNAEKFGQEDHECVKVPVIGNCEDLII